MTQEAWRAVHRYHRYWLMICLQALLIFLAVGLLVLGVLLKRSPFISLLLALTFLVQIMAAVGWFVWQRMLFREALQQKLLDGDIRPRSCFECGYNLEGYEGSECPACDARLLRQAGSPSERW